MLPSGIGVSPTWLTSDVIVKESAVQQIQERRGSLVIELDLAVVDDVQSALLQQVLQLFPSPGLLT